MSNPNQQLTVQEKNISDAVLAKINAFQKAGQLRLPPDYSAENALKAAYLILSETKNRDGQLVLNYCSKESVANAMLKMVVWGLSPLKKQCDFVPYGDKLECTPEYTGNIILAKRYGNLKSITSNAVFEGDSFEFTIDTKTGRKIITKHEQTLDSIGSKNLKGAYAVYELNDGTINVEIMNMSQIRDSWNQGAARGNSPAHKNFPDEMAKKTVINRACKLLIRASDDAVLYDSVENETGKNQTTEDVNYEIVNNSNKTPIDFNEQVEEKKADSEPVLNTNASVEEPTKESNETGPGF